MKTLLFMISFFAMVSAFEPVRDYARSWEMDTATMTEDTIVKHILLFSLPEMVLVSSDAMTVAVDRDTLDFEELCRGLATGSYGSTDMQDEFRDKFWENLISAFELLYFYPCAKDDISKRWECIRWADDLVDWLGLPKEEYKPVQEELVSFVAEISLEIIEER